MALNFTANQYERAFAPTKLCNWEIPKKGPILPKRRIGTTKIIVNDKGHLLPGIRKLNPWAYQVSDKRSKIQNSIDKMGHSDDILTTWEKRSSHVPIVVEEQTPVPHLPPCINSRRSSKDKENGSHENILIVQPEDGAFNNRRSSTDKVNGSHNNIHLEQVDYEKHHDEEISHRTNGSSKCENSTGPVLSSTRCRMSRVGSAISGPLLANAYSNDLIAQNLKYNNQKHHTLADAVDYRLPKSSDRNSELQSDDKLDSWIPAVGCKLFQSPGPTQCSKLKVFRPKIITKTLEHKENTSYDRRPQTTPRFKDLSEMDLAIYWDAAIPSVEKEVKMENVVADQVIPQNQNKVDDSTCTQNTETNNQPSTSNRQEPLNNELSAKITNIEDKRSTDSNSMTKYKLERRSSSQTRQLLAKSSEEVKSSRTETLPTKCVKLYASAPNLMDVGIQVNPNVFKTSVRKCDACNVKPHFSKPTINTDRYKSAFKAGKLNKMAVDSDTLERLHKARHLRVPKPKIPYAKKSYSIGTLMPPFSVWPRAVGQDYPDHWRLASVYQHSYKPLETRKVPLIKTVFQ